MRVSLILGLVISVCGLCTAPADGLEPWLKDSSSNSEANAIERIPFNRVTGQAQEQIRGVVDRPSFFRRLPTQTIVCDPELFTLLVRYPEIIVNIWDLMEITKVEVKRVGPYVFTGKDGAGTTCRCELLYGTSDVHVYYGTGSYSGSLAARDIDGRCVCVLHSSNSKNREGRPTVTVTMDVFLKLDNFGADLITRTLGSLVGKTADYNFVESAKFVSQLYELCETNPVAAQQLAMRLNRVDPSVRTKFSQIAARIASNSPTAVDIQAVAQHLTNDEAATKTAANNKTARPASTSSTPNRGGVATTTTPTPRENGSSRTSSAASISDGGIIVPVKPPVNLRR